MICANNILGLGNVIITKDSYLNLIIDDIENNHIEKVTSLKLVGDKEYIGLSSEGTTIYRLSDVLLLIIGLSTWPGDVPLIVIKYLFDLSLGEFVSFDKIPADELLHDESVFKYPLPRNKAKSLIEGDNSIFYVMQCAKTGPIGSLMMHAFVEIDRKGNFVSGENKTALSISENLVKSLSNKTIMYQVNSEDRRRRKFWVISYEDFPNLIIDKGYTEN